MTALDAAAAEGLAGMSVMDIADLLLAIAQRRLTVSVQVDPGPAGHDVTLETAVGLFRPFTLPGDLGDAVVARLAVVAQLDLAQSRDRLGRVQVQAGAARAELTVLVSVRPRGLGAEIRRMVRAEDVAENNPPKAKAVSTEELLGPYRIVSKLGQGGFGVVYEAEHELLQKRVAVKVLHAGVAKNAQLATSLLREGRLASRAQHPGIVSVTDFGTTNHQVYLVMELVRWPTLEQVLKDEGALPPARAVMIARQIATALAAAHEEGVIHRDLKPSNVFVSPEDLVKIGDFGVARTVEPAPVDPAREKAEGTATGSPPYMSPEHACGLRIDHRADLYALGCVLFEMLTGHLPFGGANPTEIMARHVAWPIPAVVSPHGPLPPVLLETVRRALAKKPEARYQSASEMIIELDRCALALSRKGWRKWLPL